MLRFSKPKVFLVLAASCVVASCATAKPDVSDNSPLLDLSSNIVREMLVKEVPSVGAQKAKDCQMLMVLAVTAAERGNHDVDTESRKFKLGSQLVKQVWADVLSREAAAEGVDAGEVKASVATDLANVIVDANNQGAMSNLSGKTEVCASTLTGALSRVQVKLTDLKGRGDLKSPLKA